MCILWQKVHFASSLEAYIKIFNTTLVRAVFAKNLPIKSIYAFCLFTLLLASWLFCFKMRCCDFEEMEWKAKRPPSTSSLRENLPPLHLPPLHLPPLHLPQPRLPNAQPTCVFTPGVEPQSLPDGMHHTHKHPLTPTGKFVSV